MKKRNGLITINYLVYYYALNFYLKYLYYLNYKWYVLQWNGKFLFHGKLEKYTMKKSVLCGIVFLYWKKCLDYLVLHFFFFNLRFMLIKY